MRIYSNFVEALSEIKRDVKEMGIRIDAGYQSMYEGNYETLELQNYIYTVTSPYLGALNPTLIWVDLEFHERLYGGHNPGSSWRLRPEIWEPLLETTIGGEQRFSYTYSERMGMEKIDYIIKELKQNPNSRQLFLSIWSSELDIKRLGKRRVPCTIGYYFQKRKDKLNITYLMRSCDLVTHMENDIYLAVRLLENVASRTNSEVGTFTHWIGSLHAYRTDVEGVF